MDVKKRHICKINTSYIYSFIFLVLGFLYVAIIGNPVYAVNDDLFIKNIISGAYLKVPNAYGIYMEYPLTFLMKVFYQMNKAVPWYGMLLLGSHLVSLACVIQRCTNKNKNEFRRFLIFILVMCLLVIADLSHILLVQFTVTSSILGGVAIFWFMTSDTQHGNKKFFKDNIITVLFVILSFSIRRNVLFMLIPLGGMLWIGKWFNEERSKDNNIFFCENKIPYLGMLGITGSAILIMLGLNALAYSSNDWKEYTKYNESATVLYDYCGWPEYETNQTLYESLGITEEAYKGASKDYMLCMDHNINQETLTILADYSQQQYDKKHTVEGIVRTIEKKMIVKGHGWANRPVNLMVVGLYVILLLCSLVGRNKKALIAIGCLVVGRLVAWSYVIAEGRFPIRITQSLFLAEFFLLLGIAITYEIWEVNKGDKDGIFSKLKQIVILVVAVGYFLVVLYLGGQEYRHVSKAVAKRIITAQDLTDVKDYCGGKTENFYFIDNHSISNLTEEVLDQEGSKYQNYILFGGWLSGSPIYQEKLQMQGIINAEKEIIESDNVFVIFQDIEGCSKDYLMKYYASKYESFSYQLVDTFSTHNFKFLVYQLRG